MKFITAVLFFLILTTDCFAKETINKPAMDCKNIDQYLPDCLKMECETISKDGNSVKQKILGFDKGGKCIHEQYIDKKIIHCEYAEESRKFLALQIKNSKFEPDRKVNEAIKEKMIPDYEPDLVEEIFTNECKIIKNL